MSFDWATIISIIITVISVFGGASYFFKFKTLVKLLGEFFTEIATAFEDEKVTTEELGKIIAKWHAILGVFKPEQTVQLKKKLKV